MMMVEIIMANDIGTSVGRKPALAVGPFWRRFTRSPRHKRTHKPELLSQSHRAFTRELHVIHSEDARDERKRDLDRASKGGSEINASNLNSRI